MRLRLTLEMMNVNVNVNANANVEDMSSCLPVCLSSDSRSGMIKVDADVGWVDWWVFR